MLLVLWFSTCSVVKRVMFAFGRWFAVVCHLVVYSNGRAVLCNGYDVSCNAGQ